MALICVKSGTQERKLYHKNINNNDLQSKQSFLQSCYYPENFDVLSIDIKDYSFLGRKNILLMNGNHLHQYIPMIVTAVYLKVSAQP